MASFNWVDYIILAIFFFSILSGLRNGLVREIISVGTWVAAFVVACLFSSRLAALFTGSSSVQSMVSDSSANLGVSTEATVSVFSLGVSFVCLFFLTLIIGGIINHIISGAVEGAGLGIANRFFGGIFGFIRGILIILVLIFLLQLTDVVNQDWWKASQLIPLFQPAVVWLGNLVYPGLESLKVRMGQTLQNTQNLFSNMFGV